MQKWRQHKYVLMVVIICLAAVAALVITGTVMAVEYAVLPFVAPVSDKIEMPWRGLPGWKDVLSAGIPLLSFTSVNASPVKVQPLTREQGFFASMLHYFAAIDPTEPRSFFAAVIPLLGQQSLPSAIKAVTMPDFPQFDPTQLAVKGQPLVAIYHTHTSESFIPTSGRAHSPGGTQGDIVKAGEALVGQLQKNGIVAVQSKTVHDYPSFMKAYGASEETVKKLLATYPSIQMLFDIHRDADKKENTTALINGKSAARVTIVVSTGHEGLPQPHWQQNYAFAKLLEATMNQHFPGLSRGIHLDEWRYNQHLHPRALLLEVGCQENDLSEIEYTMRMLADIIAEIFVESRQ